MKNEIELYQKKEAIWLFGDGIGDSSGNLCRGHNRECWKRAISAENVQAISEI